MTLRIDSFRRRFLNLARAIAAGVSLADGLVPGPAGAVDAKNDGVSIGEVVFAFEVHGASKRWNLRELEAATKDGLAVAGLSVRDGSGSQEEQVVQGLRAIVRVPSASRCAVIIGFEYWRTAVPAFSIDGSTQLARSIRKLAPMRWTHGADPVDCERTLKQGLREMSYRAAEHLKQAAQEGSLLVTVRSRNAPDGELLPGSIEGVQLRVVHSAAFLSARQRLIDHWMEQARAAGMVTTVVEQPEAGLVVDVSFGRHVMPVDGACFANPRLSIKVPGIDLVTGARVWTTLWRSELDTFFAAESGTAEPGAECSAYSFRVLRAALDGAVARAAAILQHTKSAE